MWADLRVAGIQLAAIDGGIIIRLVFVGNEIDAYRAVLLTVRLELELQSGPNRCVLGGERSLG